MSRWFEIHGRMSYHFDADEIMRVSEEYDYSDHRVVVHFRNQSMTSLRGGEARDFMTKWKALRTDSGGATPEETTTP